MQRITLAIDPGAKGALAILYPGGYTAVYNYISESDLLEHLRSIASEAEANDYAVNAYLEKVGGYVGSPQPGSAMFKFGRNFGFILGACQALSFAVNLIPPQKWQKNYPTPTTKTKNAAQHKRELKDHAARLFPNNKVTLVNADALLILHYATSHVAL